MQKSPLVVDAMHLFGRVEGADAVHESDATLCAAYNANDYPLCFCITIWASLSYVIQLRLTAEQWAEFLRPTRRRIKAIPNNRTDEIPNAA